MEVINVPTIESFYREGETFYHQASHNRYQVYHVVRVQWNPDAMMGAGCFVYTVDFIEYDSTSMKNVTRREDHWQLPEVSLPRTNRRDWNQREA